MLSNVILAAYCLWLNVKWSREIEYSSALERELNLYQSDFSTEDYKAYELSNK